jgi:hypothetical protein
MLLRLILCWFGSHGLKEPITGYDDGEYLIGFKCSVCGKELE